MPKSTNFTGQPIYNQLLSLVNKEKITKIGRKGNHERYVKKLDGYSHFVIMLYAVLMRFESLREIVIGMLSESHKLHHLGIDYMVKRSTLSEANNSRKNEFFEQIYFSLYQKYKNDLADSRTNKSWEHLLHIMDSTTITLFSNVLKGAGRNPKQGKKKGGIKVHTVLKAEEGVPYSIHFTSAATHDHVMLSKLKLTNGAFLAMDRAYIDYKVFQELTDDGVFYVTKMKKKLRYIQKGGHYLVNEDGLVILSDHKIELKKDDITHISRKIEYWQEKKESSSVLLTNNFDLEPEEIIAIYLRRWQIESLFYDKHIFMRSLCDRYADSHSVTDLLLTLTSHNNRDYLRPLSHSRRSLLCSHTRSVAPSGLKSLYARSRASRLALESARA